MPNMSVKSNRVNPRAPNTGGGRLKAASFEKYLWVSDFKFSELPDYISETVQDTDIVAMED